MAGKYLQKGKIVYWEAFSSLKNLIGFKLPYRVKIRNLQMKLTPAIILRGLQCMATL